LGGGWKVGLGGKRNFPEYGIVDGIVDGIYSYPCICLIKEKFTSIVISRRLDLTDDIQISWDARNFLIPKAEHNRHCNFDDKVNEH
jgi:hypothetical protein